MISACIINSHLWSNTKILHLQQNMRSLQYHSFVEYLMRIFKLHVVAVYCRGEREFSIDE